MDIIVKVDPPHSIGEGHVNHKIHFNDEEGFKIGEVVLNNQDELKHLIEELSKITLGND